jgi:hypothetical protein
MGDEIEEGGWVGYKLTLEITSLVYRVSVGGDEEKRRPS